MYLSYLCMYLSIFYVPILTCRQKVMRQQQRSQFVQGFFRKTLGLLFGSLTKKVQSKRLTNTQQCATARARPSSLLLPSLQIKQIHNTQVCMKSILTPGVVIQTLCQQLSLNHPEHSLIHVNHSGNTIFAEHIHNLRSGFSFLTCLAQVLCNVLSQVRTCRKSPF